MEATRQIQITRLKEDLRTDCEDSVAAEEPLEIRVEGLTIAVVMRTPGNDRELAAGFLLSEGIIKSARDLFDITTCVTGGSNGKGNAVDVGLVNPGNFDRSKLSRHVFTSASCGVCSKTSIDSVLRKRKPLSCGLGTTVAVIRALPRRLTRHQEAFSKTGGLHACALFGLEGELMAVREDVGRHNAMDKLLGWALLEKRVPLEQSVALLSGRASFEMLQKAYTGGIPIVAAISAPSSLAVDFARESGQTLIGFLRGKTMNVYAGRERLL